MATMKPETILKKAIEKAVKNGWEYGKTWLEVNKLINWKAGLHANVYYSVIFSHDFAKAFFDGSNTDVCIHNNRDCDATICDALPDVKRWEWHLMDMVREKDPIKYLEKFL